MNRDALEQQLSQLPLYHYFFPDPRELEFSQRVRWICQHECSQYGHSWACPPGVGTVEECRAHISQFDGCLVIATVAEVTDISHIAETLATRQPHEEITDHIAQILRNLDTDPFVLSTQSCAVCSRCAFLDGLPCRRPERMHPCVESQGINIIPILEKNGLEFQFGQNTVTWISIFLYRK